MTKPEDPTAAAGAPFERPVGQQPEPERTCEQGCNGCDDCTDYDPWNKPAATCEHCLGSGGNPLDDGITPCKRCDGEGYEWWN